MVVYKLGFRLKPVIKGMPRSHAAFDAQLVGTLANRLFEHRLWRCSGQHHIYVDFLGTPHLYNSAQATSHDGVAMFLPSCGLAAKLLPSEIRQVN